MIDSDSTVLVVDDEESIRDSCSQILSREGWRALTAEDGTIGLQQVKEIKPDLVLVDLKMPGISGIELLEAIRGIDPEIVAVVITGYPTIESAVEAMKRGAYDFLPKPFTPDELRIIIRRGLEKRRLSLEAARLRQEREMMKEYFITLVSHELRSPLSNVQQYCDTLLGGYVGPVKPEQKEIIRLCKERVKGLLKLVEDWLSVSRVEHGDIVDKLEPLELGPVLREIVNTVQSSINANQIAIRSEIPDQLPAVLGDPESLGLCFTNLINNAVKFSPEGGNVDIRLHENEEGLMVEVADHGIGIPAENLPFIFDEFYKVRTKATRSITGSGLGLALVKRIVEAHSGRIQVTSEPGKGSTFTVKLPITSQCNKDSAECV